MTLRAAVEALLRFLKHGFLAKAFRELHSAAHPEAVEPEPEHLARVSEITSLISDAHMHVTSGKPTIGLKRFKQAERLWPKKGTPLNAMPEMSAAADRIRLAGHWRRKNYHSVYRVIT